MIKVKRVVALLIVAILLCTCGACGENSIWKDENNIEHAPQPSAEQGEYRFPWEATLFLDAEIVQVTKQGDLIVMASGKEKMIEIGNETKIFAADGATICADNLTVGMKIRAEIYNAAQYEPIETFSAVEIVVLQ